MGSKSAFRMIDIQDPKMTKLSVYSQLTIHFTENHIKLEPKLMSVDSQKKKFDNKYHLNSSSPCMISKSYR